MLFNSYDFILVFFPAVFLGYYWLTKQQYYRAAMHWLVLSSFVFYSWQIPAHTFVLLLSIIFNFCIGNLLVAKTNPNWQKLLLSIGVIGNLVPLAYFKYAGFILENLHSFGLLDELRIQELILPLAISFFTFQQIAFLADTYRTGKAHKDFLEYVFCVVFFPHLIAGPLIYYREFLEQLRQGNQRALITDNIVRGSLLFTLGLAKKILLGDQLGAIVKPVFDGEVGPACAFDAWMGSFLFGFQIYFDFSAYSDMAIGLGYMFGLKLPVNFDSPYQAVTYREFWRRWHVTLFRFFRDHIYLPLKGNTSSQARVFILTFLVFFLSGLWHGAAWNFIVWGVANWAIVVLNDIWLNLPGMPKILSGIPRTVKTIIGRLFVFLAMSWTFMVFRSPDFSRVNDFLNMAFGNKEIGNSIVLRAVEESSLFSLAHQLTALPVMGYLLGITAGMLALAWFCPNAVRFMLAHDQSYSAEPSSKICFRYSIGWGAFLAMILCAALLGIPSTTKFIYFQF